MVDLHELANSGGFGDAGKALDQAGHKRMYSDEGKRVFTVKVHYSIGYTDTVEVEAKDEDEAKRLAEEEVEDCPNEESSDHVEIHHATIEE